METIKDPLLFGKILHEMGFRYWAVYMFNLIEGKKFIEEDIHADLFQEFQDIYDQKIVRSIINIPPRAGKTSLAKYFIAYCIANNPKSNFIYTSFSQSLLSQISGELAGILQHYSYRLMYVNQTIKEEQHEEKPIDEFWKNFIRETTGKEVFTSRKIITSAGGVVLFASVGSAITGYGSGIRGSKEYSGGLIIDDPNKPIDTLNSELMRIKVHTYFEETLLSRLNESNTSIQIIQQRLHLDDLSGFLLENYKEYHLLKKPLLVDGKCQIKSQYNDKRLRELQRNESMFSAQYQQEPVQEGGNLFKKEWFEHTNILPELTEYNILFAVVDSAYDDKATDDYTVVTVFGIKNRKLHIIDVYRKKIKSIDIPIEVEKFLFPYCTNNKIKMHVVWIEKKSSGITLLQGFQKNNSHVKVPKEEETKEFMKRAVGKVARANESIPYINDVDKNVLINTNISCYNEIISEVLAFPNGKHDDFTDTLIDGIRLFDRYYLKQFRDVDFAIEMFRKHA